MTYIDWEREFQKSLKSLSEKEKDEIISYYREIYSDKREAGMSDEEIISQLGDPILCAAKILIENFEEKGGEEKTGEENSEAKTKETDKDDVSEAKKSVIKTATSKKETQRGKITPALIVGWFFFTVLFIIPLYSVIFAAVVSLASVTVASAAIAFSGAVLTVASPLSFALGYSALGFVATLGAALAMAGIGILLFEVFYILTKYSAFVSLKLTKYIFKKGA